MSVYVDTSVLVALLVAEARTSVARSWLRRTRDPIVVGDLTTLEFSAVASRGFRTGQIDATKATPLIADFDLLRAQSVLHHPRDEDFSLAELIIRDF